MKFLDSNVLAYAFYDNEHVEECQKAISEGGLIDTLNLIESIFHNRERKSAEIYKSIVKVQYKDCGS